MIERVKKYIRENQMLKAGDIVAAGVSGGADSIAMLHILKSIQEEFGFFLEAVHVHHGIRGDEADRDENLVKKSARSGRFLFSPIIIRFRNFPENGGWEKKKPDGSSENRLLRRKNSALPFRNSRKKMSVGSALRWLITVMIWQKPCCIIWQGEPDFGDFPGYIPAVTGSSVRFYV